MKCPKCQDKGYYEYWPVERGLMYRWDRYVKARCRECDAYTSPDYKGPLLD